jgi:hypothetical protein
MKDARQKTFEAIDALKPYKGGNDPLWMLHRLNNIEKHRLLITVGSRLHSLDLGAHASKMMADTIAARPPGHPLQGKEFPIMSAFFGPGPDVRFPLEAGHQLFIDAPDAKPNKNLQFRFDVALYEPQVIEAQSLLETIQELTTLVEGIVTALTPRLQ